MPRLSAAPITLKETERKELEKLVNRPSTPQQLARRGKIILQAAAGKSHGEIARDLEIGKEMSRRWRRRWLDLMEQEMSVSQRLRDAPRPGTPAIFTLEQITQLYALACTPPEQYGRPISHWTASELADELIKQKIVESISTRHVGRLLATADLKPHQTRYWLNPPPTQISRPKLKISANCTSRPANVQSGVK